MTQSDPVKDVNSNSIQATLMQEHAPVELVQILSQLVNTCHLIYSAISQARTTGNAELTGSKNPYGEKQTRIERFAEFRLTTRKN